MDEIDKRKDAIEDQYDKEKELIEQRRDEYKKQRDEDDYEKDLKEQQDKIDEINRKIELARRDNSIAGKSKLQDFLQITVPPGNDTLRPFINFSI